ncbi:hypothetical protein NITUZ_40406 [Candidatus Nitrosotenuis uzonensis]|uniref:Uncharacterized protein n=1 Tax=Candidatus Nitrosotenuis uzonensis TaxID=1407055 RepID=V6AUQ1_9ARCH|nr:hypothetical protein NITUZ_40406 [Candidatus Nitrosotenuis uzonensis]
MDSANAVAMGDITTANMATMAITASMWIFLGVTIVLSIDGKKSLLNTW